MPDPALAQQINAKASKQREPKQYAFKKSRIETYEVLGKILTTNVSESMTKEQAFIKAVRESGGEVYRKYYPEFQKYEITAIVFPDAALVKNDPTEIAKQDFSFFGADADRIRGLAIREAERSQGGIHFFENGFGIPVLTKNDGRIFFLSMDEMKAGTGRLVRADVVTTNIDPRTFEEFRQGAKALQEGDRIMIERLKRAGGAHSDSRKESFAPVDGYTLLDGKSGEEIGVAAANSSIGKSLAFDSQAFKFIPEKTLIDHFASCSQMPKPESMERPWEWIFLFSTSKSEEDRTFPIMYSSFILHPGKAGSDGSGFDYWPGKTKNGEKNQSVLGDTINGMDTMFWQFKTKETKIKPVPKNAQTFDGFPFSTKETLSKHIGMEGKKIIPDHETIPGIGSFIPLSERVQGIGRYKGKDRQQMKSNELKKMPEAESKKKRKPKIKISSDIKKELRLAKKKKEKKQKQPNKSLGPTIKKAKERLEIVRSRKTKKRDMMTTKANSLLVPKSPDRKPADKKTFNGPQKAKEIRKKKEPKKSHLENKPNSIQLRKSEIKGIETQVNKRKEKSKKEETQKRKLPLILQRTRARSSRGKR